MYVCMYVYIYIFCHIFRIVVGYFSYFSWFSHHFLRIAKQDAAPGGGSTSPRDAAAATGGTTLGGRGGEGGRGKLGSWTFEGAKLGHMANNRDKWAKWDRVIYTEGDTLGVRFFTAFCNH